MELVIGDLVNLQGIGHLGDNCDIRIFYDRRYSFWGFEVSAWLNDIKKEIYSSLLSYSHASKSRDFFKQILLFSPEIN